MVVLVSYFDVGETVVQVYCCLLREETRYTAIIVSGTVVMFMRSVNWFSINLDLFLETVFSYIIEEK